MKTDITPTAPACLRLGDGAVSDPVALEEHIRLLDRIEAALRRMDHGTYGKCVKCGSQMDLHTLEQDPATETCHVCAIKAAGNA